MAVVHPEVLWAQRSSESDETKNIVYLTVNLPDIVESSLQYNLEPTKISFKATSGNDKTGSTKEYAFELDLFAEVVPEKSGKRLTTRSFALVLRKKEQQAEYWPRLTKEKVKNAYIKTDFSKWVDEDEQDGEVVKEDDDFDMNALGGGMPGGMGLPGGDMGMPSGGMGGLGGLDFEKASKPYLIEMGKSGAPAGGDDGEDSDDDDGPPPLEEA
ncbi:CS domain-containing protein [Mycena indigotica]|uniref:CS domain-containing protein n=1 Tax=Mycena indigotica TaxID=2126181 RepID=A0A8H6SW08_9AGAR|nr:CS domain-containing protein [Mycena indigotica]KAF7306486.1 CS domain-containing protein [Mycena indigotica]